MAKIESLDAADARVIARDLRKKLVNVHTNLWEAIAPLVNLVDEDLEGEAQTQVNAVQQRLYAAFLVIEMTINDLEDGKFSPRSDEVFKDAGLDIKTGV